jgi:hypothetical protein
MKRSIEEQLLHYYLSHCHEQPVIILLPRISYEVLKAELGQRVIMRGQADAIAFRSSWVYPFDLEDCAKDA